MKKKTISIAITGVGGGVGQSIVKCFNNSNYRIIGLDASPLSAGLYAVDKAYIIPLVNDSSYIDEILAICKKEKCQVLLPGLDLELLKLSNNSDKFTTINTTVAVSRPKVIKVCDDKLLTTELLTRGGVNAPKTFSLVHFLEKQTDKNTMLSYPIIVKQKKGGSRSINVFLINNQNELNNLLQKPSFNQENFVAQEYIKGDEFTCGTVNFNGKCYGVIVMKRELRAGDTHKCFTVKNKIIEKEVKKTVQLLNPFGACNVQLRLKNNKAYVLEINPRCSGTTAARNICGFNEPQMIVDYIIKNKTPRYSIKSLTILRYWKELVVENKLVSEMVSKGKITNKHFKSL